MRNFIGREIFVKSFDAVDIGFENGEYVIIPARYFHTCTLRGMDVKVFCTGTHILQLSYMRYILGWNWTQQ